MRLNFQLNRPKNTVKYVEKKDYTIVYTIGIFIIIGIIGLISFNIYKNNKCTSIEDKILEYTTEYAEGNNLLKLKEGDYVIVKVFTNNYLELIPVKQKQEDLIKKYRITGINGKIDFEKEKATDLKHFIKESCRLIDLKVSNNDSLLFEYNFFSDNYRDYTDDPVVTLIIGVNGAGKSRALGIITEIFGA